MGLLGTNFSDILIEIIKFSFKNMRLKLTFVSRPQCVNVCSSPPAIQLQILWSHFIIKVLVLLASRGRATCLFAFMIRRSFACKLYQLGYVSIQGLSHKIHDHTQQREITYSCQNSQQTCTAIKVSWQSELQSSVFHNLKEDVTMTSKFSPRDVQLKINRK